MEKLRKLSGQEIESCKNFPQADESAVEEFLSNMEGSYSIEISRFKIEAWKHKWGPGTMRAIEQGINMASGG